MKDGRLARIFSSVTNRSICVVGDFMVDAYTEGSIERISPEAPVSILHVEKESFRPGGAGNVVLNLISLGAKVFSIGRVGDDRRGKDLLTYLEKQGADLQGIFFEKDYCTTVKNRLIADKQQILRLDHERIDPVSKNLEEKAFELFSEKISSISVLAISDYGKGFLSDTLLKKMIQKAQESNVTVIVDPKGRDFTKYAGADLIKPNEKEAYIAANLPRSQPLEIVANTLMETVNMNHLVITRSSKGISVFNKKTREDFPVHSKEVVDVTGAGDTVLAALSIALANNLDISEAIYLSNICAGIAIERVGCPQVTLEEVAKRLLLRDTGNKIFDEDHLFALKHILKSKHTILLGLDKGESFSLTLYKKLKQLAEKNKSVLVYLKNPDPDQELVNILSSLTEVGFIIIKRKKFDHIIEEIHPEEVYLYKEGNLKALTLSEVC